MTTSLSATAMTLLDWGKRLDPNGKVAAVIELLAQTNQMLPEMMVKEGNLPTGERTTIRTGLPTAYWRMFNQYVATSKSTTAQVTEDCGMLEAWSSTDKDLAELGGNLNAWRLSEAAPFVEAMNQEMQDTVIYGNGGTAPSEFTGLSVRYSSLSAANADNIIAAGGAGNDNYSIWLVVWGENTCFTVFPKGSKAGLVHENLGLTTVTDSNGAKMRAYEDRFQWKLGLVLKDWRYAVRVANIDVSALVAKSGAADLTECLIKATYRIPNLDAGKPAFYMNRTCAEFLDIQRRDDVSSGGGLNYEVVDGKRIMKFRGIPIRIVDRLVTETTAVT